MAGDWNAVVCGAALPATERGKKIARIALPDILLPPMVVRLAAGSPATPAGAVASTSTVELAAGVVRMASEVVSSGVYVVAVPYATLAKSGVAGSGVAPPVGDP